MTLGVGCGYVGATRGRPQNLNRRRLRNICGTIAIDPYKKTPGDIS